MSDVDCLWTDEFDVIEDYTDRDLVEDRTDMVGVVDESKQMMCDIVALQGVWEDEDGEALIAPEVADRALRIYLAALMDAGVVADHRGPLDIAVAVPPRGWVGDNLAKCCPDVEVPSLKELPEELQKDRLTVGTTPAVKELLGSVYEQAGYETMMALCKDGLAFCVGRDTRVLPSEL